MKQNSRHASDSKNLILRKTACYNILFQNHAQTDTAGETKSNQGIRSDDTVDCRLKAPPVIGPSTGKQEDT